MHYFHPSCLYVCCLFLPLYASSFRSLLYFGILLTERAATSERTSQRFVQRQMRGVFHQLARCCGFAGHCLKENELPPFVGRSLFLYACVVPFSCQRPLGVSAYFNNFLCLIQFYFFKIRFFHSYKLFNSVETIAINMNKQFTFNSFTNKTTYKYSLIIYKFITI